MKRKIIKQGHNTLTLTLPSKWISEQNIKAGDEIDLIERERSLIINGNGSLKVKTSEIDIRDFTVPMIWRYIQSVYRAGCNEITINFDPKIKEYEDAYHYYTTQYDYSKLGEKIPAKPAIAMIQEIVNRFIGIDIVETGKGYCKIKEMAEATQKEFEQSLRRIFQVIIHLFERIIEAINNNEIGDANLCKEIHALDLNVDKLVDYCARIMNKDHTIFCERKKQLIFSSLFILELVGDEFKYIGKHFAISNKNVKEVKDLTKKVEDHFKMYYKMFYSFNRDLVVEFGKKDIEVYEAHFNIKNKLSGENRSISKHLMLISKLTLSLVELRIQMEF